MIGAAVLAFALCAAPAPRASDIDSSARAPEAASAAPAPAASPAPLRIFLRAGEKTHGPGQHDHPQWLADWMQLLPQRGAVVEGALRFPSADELARTDVLVMYCAEGGSIHGEERARLERFLARGGGIAVLHDAICGDDPQWFASVVGGAWEHGHSKWQEGVTDLYLTDRESPLTAGMENWRFDDELYYELHVRPEAHVLMSGFHSVFAITPQAWTYAKDDYRAFVSIQGHEHASFSHPAWRAFVLRGIAWAGKREVDLLVSREEKAALAYPPGGPLAPERAASALELHPDFELALVAAEPACPKAISIEWDARGRLWAALTMAYPEKAQFSGVAPHDEIAILSDRDGDGRMESRSTFHAGLDLVTSLVMHRDGVIVSASPDILWLRDTNGDDRCDRVEKLYTGFGFRDTHATISNLRWGLDGWIYATQGYSGNDSRHVTNAAGVDFGHIGNGLFRFRPDGSAIEMVSNYGSNTWGLDFADDGELFFSMANGAHLRHVVMPEASLAKARWNGVESWADLPDHDRVHPLVTHTEAPYAQIDFVGGFTAASGCCLYTGGAWPEAWSNATFVAEPTVNLVHCDRIAPKGVTYAASVEREVEFLSGRDLWFRPVHMRVGPDGALYVVDFYNQAVVHNDTRGPQHGPTNAAVRPDRDHEHGRIWRVQHKQAKALPKVDLASATPAELAAALAHPNSWVRQTASRLIAERQPKSTYYGGLQQQLESGSAQAKIAALWTMLRIDKLPNDLAKLLADADAGVRKNATWVLREELAQHARGAELPKASCAKALRALLEDRDARLRLLAMLALTDLEESESSAQSARPAAWPFELWARLGDDWSRSAARRAAKPGDLAAWQALAQRASSGELALALAKDAARDPVFGWALAASLLRDATIDAGWRAQVLRSWGEALANKPAQFEQLASGLDELLADPARAVVLAALPIAQRLPSTPALAARIQALGERLQQELEGEETPDAARLESFQALLTIPERRAAAIERAALLLAAARGPEIQSGAAKALASSGDPDAIAAIASAWLGLAPAARDAAFEAILARPAYAQLLLDALAKGELDPLALGPQKLHRLRTHPDAAVAQRASELLASAAASSAAAVDALVAKLLPEFDAPGDPVHGKEVFAQNCAACHTANGAGGKVGPDITGMGAHGAADLLPIILDPNRTVEAAYSEWTVKTVDGETFAGVLARDGADAILLRSSAGDKEVRRSEIEELRNTGRSPMPTGLESVGVAGLRDVIAYLASGTEGFRVLDLKPVVSRNSLKGIYDSRHANEVLKPRAFGITPVLGVPFELLDPARTPNGNNALVLKGGSAPDWECKLSCPARVEVKVGFELAQVHVLGGIAAWGYPYHKDKPAILRWTWNYADGTHELVELHNGVEFGDWIARHDVPGSQFVEGVLAEDSWGQLRFHSLAPGKRGVVASITLESGDERFAPTLLALTAELPGAKRVLPEPAKAREPVALDVLLVGGGSSHDFRRWFADCDRRTLAAAGLAESYYTERVDEILPQLPLAKVLWLANNQPLEGAALRSGIRSFVESGGGLLCLHPATWYNWADWPEYNRELVGGGARGHESYAEFEVELLDPAHPIAQGVPKSFRVSDELYRFEPDPSAELHVIAQGRSLATGAEFPVLWTRAVGRGRVVGCTLGHDGAAHELPAFQRMLANSARWLLAPAAR